MKTSREHSLAETESAFALSAFFRHHLKRGRLTALILILSGLHPHVFVPSALAESLIERKNGGGSQWSVQVEQVDCSDASPDSCFGAAIRENLLGELAKTKKFKQVLGSDDRKTNDVPDLLILKTTVQEYSPSGEPHRASLDDVGLLGVIPGLFLRFWGRTAVSGVTKVKVRIQLYTQKGHLILEDVVGGNVQSIGGNLRDPRKLARHIAADLKRSSLPETATTLTKHETSRYQVGTITAAQSH
jgi:hypothetical protein